MRTWSEATAVAWINRNSASTITGKAILVKKDKGLGGLTACSAASYLVQHCGYRLG